MNWLPVSDCLLAGDELPAAGEKAEGNVTELKDKLREEILKS